MVKKVIQGIIGSTLVITIGYYSMAFHELKAAAADDPKKVEVAPSEVPSKVGGDVAKDPEKKKEPPPLKKPVDPMTITVSGQGFAPIPGKDNEYVGNEDVDVSVGEASETISNLGGASNAKPGNIPYDPNKPAVLTWDVRPVSADEDPSKVLNDGEVDPSKQSKIIGENSPELKLTDADVSKTRKEDTIFDMGANTGPVTSSAFKHPGQYVLGNHSARRLEGGGGTANSNGSTVINIEDITPPTVSMNIADSGGESSWQGMREYGQAGEGSKKMEFARQGGVFDDSGAGNNVNAKVTIPISPKYNMGPMYLVEDRRYSLEMKPYDNWDDNKENMDRVENDLKWQIVDENNAPVEGVESENPKHFVIRKPNYDAKAKALIPGAPQYFLVAETRDKTDNKTMLIHPLYVVDQGMKTNKISE